MVDSQNKLRNTFKPLKQTHFGGSSAFPILSSTAALKASKKNSSEAFNVFWGIQCVLQTVQADCPIPYLATFIHAKTVRRNKSLKKANLYTSSIVSVQHSFRFIEFIGPLLLTSAPSFCYYMLDLWPLPLDWLLLPKKLTAHVSHSISPSHRESCTMTFLWFAQIFSGSYVRYTIRRKRRKLVIWRFPEMGIPPVLIHF